MPSLIKTIGLFGFSLFSVFGCKSQQIKENINRFLTDQETDFANFNSWYSYFQENPIHLTNEESDFTTDVQIKTSNSHSMKSVDKLLEPGDEITDIAVNISSMEENYVNEKKTNDVTVIDSEDISETKSDHVSKMIICYIPILAIPHPTDTPPPNLVVCFILMDGIDKAN